MTATTGVAILGLTSRESNISKEVVDDFFTRADKTRCKPRYAELSDVTEVQIIKCRQRHLVARLWL